jgi:hypothetical protein
MGRTEQKEQVDDHMRMWKASDSISQKNVISSLLQMR